MRLEHGRPWSSSRPSRGRPWTRTVPAWFGHRARRRIDTLRHPPSQHRAANRDRPPSPGRAQRRQILRPTATRIPRSRRRPPAPDRLRIPRLTGVPRSRDRPPPLGQVQRPRPTRFHRGPRCPPPATLARSRFRTRSLSLSRSRVRNPGVTRLPSGLRLQPQPRTGRAPDGPRLRPSLRPSQGTAGHRPRSRRSHLHRLRASPRLPATRTPSGRRRGLTTGRRPTHRLLPRTAMRPSGTGSAPKDRVLARPGGARRRRRPPPTLRGQTWTRLLEG
jgi:hypothetical protein